MRTSLNEIQQIEEHLFKQLNGEDETLFQANLLLNKAMIENIQEQKEAYRLIRNYGRRQLKREIESVHKKLFFENTHRSFRQAILALFQIK